MILYTTPSRTLLMYAHRKRGLDKLGGVWDITLHSGMMKGRLLLAIREFELVSDKLCSNKQQIICVLLGGISVNEISEHAYKCWSCSMDK